REIVLRRPLVAPFHEGANRRRRGVKDRHPVPLADVPEAIALRPVGSSFVHHARRAIRERAVYQIGMPGHPADIGCAPEDVVFLEIENISGGGGDAGEIATRSVHDSFWLP